MITKKKRGGKMVEVGFREHYEMADLAGMSVAEAREQYKELLGIPDKAKAIVNGKEVKKAREPEMELGNGDKLAFQVKQRSRVLLLAGALLLALVASGGIFVYTWLSASVIIGATGDYDFAAVEPSSPPLSFSTNIFGHYRGDIPIGYLFEITPDGDYTGDMTVEVSLTNVMGLSKVYKHLNLKLELWDSAGSPVNMFASDTGHTFLLLTLDNGAVEFPLDQSAGVSPFKVKLAGGGYRTHGKHPLSWTAGGDTAPILYCDVHQR